MTTTSSAIARYPLSWPAGYPRTKSRREADFKVDFIRRSRDETMNALKLLGARSALLSSNVPLRQDGLPLAGMPEPADPGVAVYFDRMVPAPTAAEPWAKVARPYVIACDTYSKVRWNLRAIGVTVDALRSIQRHGASSMLEQAFQGFLALPPKRDDSRPWWDVLGVAETASLEQVRAAYLELSRIHHPDTGGDTARMAEINRAFEAARTGR